MGRMGTAATRTVSGLFAALVSAVALCSFGVEPVSGWMMRHHCPMAMLMSHQHARPMQVHGAARHTMP
jgi:hypothetical protein